MIEQASPANRQSSILRRPALRLSLLLVALLAVVWADPLFVRRNFAGRDPMAYHYPLEKAIHDAWGRGRLPVWVSEISGGRPLLANPNVGALYPPRPILSAVPFAWAVRVFPILHWAISGVGMFLLLGVLGVSAAGAWVGAATYVFSAVSVSYVFYPNTHPGMALLPWLVWAMARPSSSPARGTIAVSIVWALLFLSGDAFIVSLGLVACALWILVSGRPQWTGLAWRLAGGLVLGGLAAAPQIVASALWIPETNRAISGLTLKGVVLFSISPFRLLEFVIPFPFGTVWDLDWTQSWAALLYHRKQLGYFTSFYAGGFAVIAVARTWKSKATGARFGRWMLLAGLLVSVPPSFLPASWGDIHSPIPLRYPEKFAVGLILALGMLAAFGFDSWRQSRPRITAVLAAAGVLTVLAAATALFPGPSGRMAARWVGSDPKWAPTAGRLLPGAFAEAGLLWIATVIALDAANRGTRRSLIASLALLTAVPIAANRKIAPTFREEHLFAPSPLDRYEARADPRGDYRTFDVQTYTTPSQLKESDVHSDVSASSYTHRSWLYFTHALWNRGTIFNTNIDQGDLSRVESLRYVSFLAGQYRDSQAFFGSLSLKWAVRLRDQRPLAGYHRIRGNDLVDWDEHEAAFPDVRLVERWREEPGALQALNTLRGLTTGEIVVESGVSRAGAARPGKLTLLEKSPERMVAEVEAPDPTWLFVLRGYWSYRTILLDGRRVEDVPAQLAFSAVSIPGGRHRLEWKEDVPGGSFSWIGPVLFLLAAAAIASGRRAGLPR